MNTPVNTNYEHNKAIDEKIEAEIRKAGLGHIIDRADASVSKDFETDFINEALYILEELEPLLKNIVKKGSVDEDDCRYLSDEIEFIENVNSKIKWDDKKRKYVTK